MRLLYLLLALGIATASCNTPSSLFSGRTPHEQYADRLNSAGLQQSAAGMKWFSAAERALRQPLSISLPYEETGYFDVAAPAAAGYRFSARRGDKIDIRVTKKPVLRFPLFLDLWQPDGNALPKRLATADSALRLEREVSEDGSYILRLQPELLAGGEYTITIRTLPSIGFPVPAASNPRIISLWGVDRDGGTRRHEGIDIAAAKRTPLVACAEGYVTSTRENNLGGKVVFVRPEGRNYTLYYAHLDEQLVREGQRVRQGDTVGLMGNTGNAQHTIPHLHFGIYTNSGAVDPLPFVDTDRPSPARITASLQPLNDFVRANKGAALLFSPERKSGVVRTLPANTILTVTGATAGYYKVMTVDSTEAYVLAGGVTPTNKAFNSYRLPAAARLLDRPVVDAAGKLTMEKGKSVEMLGVNEGYYFVRVDGNTGWVAM